MASISGRTAKIVAVIAVLAAAGAYYLGLFNRPPPPPKTPASQVGGQWRDQFGTNFTIHDTGGKLELAGNNSAKIFRGSGTVQGSGFEVTFTNSVNGASTHCIGARANPGEITADCSDSVGNVYVWHLRRRGE